MRYTIKEVMDYCSRNGISVYECWDEKDRRKKFYKMLIPVFESGVLIPVSNREYICKFQSTLPREERQQYCTKNLFIFIQYRQ